FLQPICQYLYGFWIELSFLAMKRVREIEIMLKGVSHIVNFDEARGSRATCVYVLRDQLVIFSAHDPVELPVQDQSWRLYPSPRCSKVQFLQLLIKCERPSIEMRMIFAFGPNLREFGTLAQNLFNGFVFDQPVVVKIRCSFHPLVYIAGRLAH